MQTKKIKTKIWQIRNKYSTLVIIVFPNINKYRYFLNLEVVNYCTLISFENDDIFNFIFWASNQSVTVDNSLLGEDINIFIAFVGSSTKIA